MALLVAHTTLLEISCHGSIIYILCIRDVSALAIRTKAHVLAQMINGFCKVQFS